MEIKIKRIENGKLPEYKTLGSAGADCYARLENKITIKPKTVETIPLGFAVEIPEGFEMQIRGRSGNAGKKWVQVFNSPGTIDSDYRGEVGAILYNASNVDFEVNPNDRIAQAVIAPVFKAEWEETSELSETCRGTNGFGSTGVNNIEKFYEPFKDWNLVEKMLDKTVIIEKNITAKFVAVGKDIRTKMLLEFDTGNVSNRFLFMSPYEAFQKVMVDGHRFGQELNYEDD